MSNGSTLFNDQAPAVPHLVQGGGGVSGEIADLRRDLKASLNKLAPMTVDEFTNPVAASTNAIKTAVATVATPVSYTGAALNGTLGSGTMPIPRNVTATVAGGTPAHAPATATFTGLYNGKTQTDTINLNQAGGTVAGTKPFDKVTQISMPAGDGVDATVAFGFGTGLGVELKPKARAGGAILVVADAMDGSILTTGALNVNGLYTPATAPDGAHDYAVWYEFDPTASLP